MIVGHSLIFRQLLHSHLHPDLAARAPALARGLSEGKLGYCAVACCDLDFDAGERCWGRGLGLQGLGSRGWVRRACA